MKSEEDKQYYVTKYLQWHCKQFTDENKAVKWCPGLNCDLLIERSDFATRNIVQCKCGQTFCFKCGHEDHVPATCYLVECWLAKEKNDSENLTWIKANTKPCPGCKNPIEKN